MPHVPTKQNLHGVSVEQEGVSMPSRKKKWVLLRGTISGTLIVGDRGWYEREGVNKKGGLWKQLYQSDDYEMLNQMMKLGNPPDSPSGDIDEWFKGANRC